jgi:hypothetical protein
MRFSVPLLILKSLIVNPKLKQEVQHNRNKLKRKSSKSRDFLSVFKCAYMEVSTTGRRTKGCDSPQRKQRYNLSAIAKEFEVNRFTISSEPGCNFSPGYYGLYTAKPARNVPRQGRATRGHRRANWRRISAGSSPKRSGATDRPWAWRTRKASRWPPTRLSTRSVHRDKGVGGDLHKSLRRTHRRRKGRFTL